MDKTKAIKALKDYRPSSPCLLSEAYTVAIAAIEESMVQKPATNSNYAAALAAWDEFGKCANGAPDGMFGKWCLDRLNSDKPNCA